MLFSSKKPLQPTQGKTSVRSSPRNPQPTPSTSDQRRRTIRGDNVTKSRLHESVSRNVLNSTQTLPSRQHSPRPATENPSVRSGSPLNRTEGREQEELKQCSFKPNICKESQILAKKKRTTKRIDEALYEDAKTRVANKQMAIARANEQANVKATSRKLSPQTRASAQNKLRKGIEFVMGKVEKDSKGKLSYHALGKLLNKLGLYKKLYSPDDEGNDLDRTLSEREAKENEFQENLWKIIGESDCGADPAQVTDLLVLLLDSVCVSTETLVDSVQRLLAGSRLEQRNGSEVSEIKAKLSKYEFTHRRLTALIWSPVQLVKAYKSLRNPVPVASTDVMRSRNMPKVAAATCTFAPEILSRSRMLAQQQFSKYLEVPHDGSHEMSHDDLEDLDWASHLVADEKNFSLGEAYQLPQTDKPISSRDSSPHCNNRNESNELTTLPQSKFYATLDMSAHSSQKKLIPCPHDIGARIQLLYEKHREAMQIVEQKRTQSKRDLLNSCTFKPRLTASRNYSKTLTSTTQSQKREIRSSVERELETCTFHPKVNKGSPVSRGMMPPTGRKKVLDRIEEGQEVDVEVNVAPGVKRKLILRKGNTVSKAVGEFVRRYGLGKNEACLMTKLLTNELSRNRTGSEYKTMSQWRQWLF